MCVDLLHKYGGYTDQHLVYRKLLPKLSTTRAFGIHTNQHKNSDYGLTEKTNARHFNSLFEKAVGNADFISFLGNLSSIILDS